MKRLTAMTANTLAKRLERRYGKHWLFSRLPVRVEPQLMREYLRYMAKEHGAEQPEIGEGIPPEIPPGIDITKVKVTGGPYLVSAFDEDVLSDQLWCVLAIDTRDGNEVKLFSNDNEPIWLRGENGNSAD